MRLSPFRSPLASLVYGLLVLAGAASGSSPVVDDALADSRPPASSTTEAAKGPADDESEFIRLTKTEKGGPAAMEKAIVRFVRGEGDQKTVVDLIGAVHIGEGSYYKRLNEKFTEYETLLYELV